MDEPYSRYDLSDPFSQPDFMNDFLSNFISPDATYSEYLAMTQGLFNFVGFVGIHPVSKPHYGNWLTPVESSKISFSLSPSPLNRNLLGFRSFFNLFIPFPGKNIILWHRPGGDPNYGTLDDEATIPFDSSKKISLSLSPSLVTRNLFVRFRSWYIR